MIVEYKVDDLVALREHPLSNAVNKFSAKLADRWSRPYKVTNVFNGVDLVVVDVEDHTRVRTVHVNDVVPYVHRPKDMQVDKALLDAMEGGTLDGVTDGGVAPRHNYNLRSQV